jgi:hypothetical protein
MIDKRVFFVTGCVVLLGCGMPVQAGMPVDAQAQSSQQWSWEDAWRRIVGRRQQDPPLGSRGSGLCLIAPVATGQNPVPVVWRQQPMLVWQGMAGRIEVYDEQTRELMGSRLAAIAANYAPYVGKPLVPGRTYEAQVFVTPKSQFVAAKVVFQMMTAADRQRIEPQLAALADPAATAEERVQRRVNFWMEQGLWEEAIAELYSVVQPSEALRQMRQQLVTKLCVLPPAQGQ